MGWNWIGRLRNRTLGQLEGKTTHGISEEGLLRPSHEKPHHAGPRALPAVQSPAVRLHVVRQAPKGRIHKSGDRTPIRASSNRKIAAHEREVIDHVVSWLTGASCQMNYDHLPHPHAD
jgi:hypothetical protein